MFAALLLPSTLSGGAQPNSDVNQARPSLAGQLLIAAPDIPDARLRQAVVVVMRHGPEGGYGIVLNRPTGDQPMADLFAYLGHSNENITGNVPISSGGPVQPELFFILHSTDYRQAETVDLTGDLATTATLKILHDIAAKAGPKKFLIAFGYVGWLPGQLELQMSMKGWFTAPLDPKLVFDADRDRLWELAIAARPLGRGTR